MKKYFLWLGLLLISRLVPAQTIITGRVVSNDKVGVPGLSVLAHPKYKPDRIVSFSFTDAKGVFRIEFSSKDDSVGISVKSLTHRDTTICIANRNQELNFVLPVQNHEIREVTVNARAITGKRDTITYLVSKFAQIKDQSIGDVISKMPGFEVTTEGQVLYQGNPIQKYYIEGMDLLENRYSIANKNLPYGAVGAVEVLENHQPIKALQSRTFSSGTSINLKLKRNIATTGTAQIGAGLPLLLRYLNITPMLFSQKQQIVSTLQSNNTSEDLNDQNQPMQFSSGMLDGAENQKTNVLGITRIAQPQIDRKRYLKNNANLLSYNHLFKVNPLTELKVNASFYHDHQKESGVVTSIYHLPEGDYSLKESTVNNYFNTSLSTNFTLTQNVAKKYLKEQFKFSRFWDYETGFIQNPDKQQQRAETPYVSAVNTFDLLLPVGSHFIRVYSLLNFNNSPQKLSFWPGVFSDRLNEGQTYKEAEQEYHMKEYSGQLFLRFTLTRKFWSFDTEPGFNFEFQNHRSFLKKDNIRMEVDSLKNDYNWNNIELYLTEKINFKKENIRFGLDIPIKAIRYQMNDHIHQSIAPTGRLLFSPMFWYDCDFQKFWSISGTIKHASRLGDASQLTQGYIVKDYRLMQRRSDNLDDKRVFLANLELEYKNPVAGFFSVGSWSNNQTTRSLIYRNIYTGTGIFLYDAVKSDNRAITNNLSLNTSWVSSGQKITISLKGQFMTTRYEYLLNQSRGSIHNRLLVLQPTIGINSLKKIGLDYNLKLSEVKQRNIQAANTILGQVHKFSFYYYPSEKHWMGGNIEYYNFGKELHLGNNGLFANLGYTFKPANNRFEYKLKCTNLFNSRQVVDYLYSDISLTESHYYIRPREIMLIVSFSLTRSKK